MLDSSHGSAYPHKGPDGAPCFSSDVYGRSLYDLRKPAQAASIRPWVPGTSSVRRRVSGSPSRLGRVAVGAAVPEVGAWCRGTMSDRLRKVRATEARRAWIECHGEASPATPVWLTRDAWIDDVRAWAASPEFAPLCASEGVSIASATVVAIAVLWAESADHGTGRNAAVTRERIAAKLGCAIKTVSRAWKVLGAAGWAVEAARGHGSSSGHTVGNRPSIWHLVSRRPTNPAAADSGENVPLPPKAGSGLLPPVGNYSPSGRERAREEVSTPNHPARRRWRAGPRPLAVQRLAAGLVTPAVGHGPDNVGRRSALIVGLDRGHIGAVCDAITRAGIDANAWTPRALASALEVDGKSRGWSWPDRIDRPGAFLVSRLRRLPAQPDRSGPVDGGTAAGLEQPRRAPAEPSAARTEPVGPTVPERVQTAAGRILARQLLIEHQQRRMVDTQPPRESAASVRRSAPLAVVAEVAQCVLCGCAGAPRRRFLPAHRANVCDACWGQ